jgi:hypothetical protein
VAISYGAKRNLGTEPLSRAAPAAPDNRRRHAAEADDFRLKPGLHSTRNRKFESISLQRRVQRAAYDREGFIVVPDVSSAGDVAELRRVTDDPPAVSQAIFPITSEGEMCRARLDDAVEPGL